MISCIFNYDSIVKYLLSNGCNPNIQDKNGKTGLMLACAGNHDNIVSILTNPFIDKEIMNNKGKIVYFVGYNNINKI
jgi:ankyrin repeat protein